MTVLATAQVVLEGETIGFTQTLAGAEAAMLAAGERMSAIGMKMSTHLTLPLTAIGTAAVGTAADFDAAMRKIAGLTATPENQVEAWKEKVRTLAMQYGVTAKEAADALYYITSSGLKGDRAMSALEASLKGAAVGLGDTGTIAHAAVSAMNAYTKSGLSAAQATDILAAGAKYSNLPIASLAPVLGRVTGMAAALNIPFTDVVSTMAIFSHTGTEADEAATQLSQVMSTLLEHNKESVKALAAHGLSLANLRKEAAGPGGLISVLRTLDKAFGGNTDQLRLVIPNIRAFRGVMNALAQDGKFVDSVVSGVANSTGTLDRAFRLAQGPAFQMKQLWAQIKDALIDIGNAVIPTVVPVLKEFVGYVKDAAHWFSELSPWVQKFIVSAAGIAAVSGPLLYVGGGMVTVFGNLAGVLTGRTLPALKALWMVFGNVWIAAENLTFRLGITTAFAAAAEAGTGLRGVLIGLVPGLQAVGAAMLPFIGGGVIAAGLGLIVMKWMEMKTAVDQATAAMKESTEAQDALFKGVDPKTAAHAVDVFNDRIKKLQDELAKATKHANDVQMATTFAADATSTGMTPAVKETTAAAQEHVTELQATIDRLTAVRNTLKTVADTYAAAAQQIVNTNKSVETNVTWLDEAHTALDKMDKKLAGVATRSQFLGDTFDAGQARTRILSEAIDQLVEAGVPLDASLNEHGLTLRQLGKQLVDAAHAEAAFKEAQKKTTETLDLANSAAAHGLTPWETYVKTTKALNFAVESGHMSWDDYQHGLQGAHDKLTGVDKELEHAQELVKKALTPQEQYNQDMVDLNLALARGVITQAQYAEGIKNVTAVLNGSKEMSKELNQAMKDIAAQGVSTFVDSVFGAKTSFSDFVKSALEDIAKLIIKLELMKVLFPSDSGGKFLGGIFGFADGGYLQPGQVGMVGEAGAELISGGRSGVTVTPLPSMSASSGAVSRGDSVGVTLNIQATDARGVADLFANNDGLVAQAFVRAFRRSSALRAALGLG